MTEINPEATASSEHGLFGIPTDPENSELILLPVPWDVTTSYGGGASDGPDLIRKASPQIDLFDFELNDQWKRGFHMLEIDDEIVELNRKNRQIAQSLIEQQEVSSASAKTAEFQESLNQVNLASEQLNDWVYNQCKAILAKEKRAAVIGGDHSSPFGCIKAHLEHYQGDIGILHFDAHLDLRNSYQGFHHSHASIMYNVMQLDPTRLVQVGIRDFAQSEYDFSQNHNSIDSHYDTKLSERLFSGESFQSMVDEIISPLPKQVYVSFDIDGLDAKLCPGTGTPVPGGLSYQQATYILRQLCKSGRQIVGFDLCEVAGSDEWNGNVGARILYQLCGWTTYEH